MLLSLSVIFIMYFMAVSFTEWSAWNEWSTCSRSCCGGEQIRNRQCLSTGNDTSGCIGDSSQVRICNTQRCPNELFVLMKCICNTYLCKERHKNLTKSNAACFIRLYY